MQQCSCQSFCSSLHLCAGFLLLVLCLSPLLLLPLCPCQHTIFDTQLSHTQLPHTHTQTFTQHLDNTHTQLCHTQSFTHTFVAHNLSHTHTTLSNTILHTQLCDTPSFSHTFSLHGRHGAWQHRCLFCLAGVALIGTGLVWLHAGPCLDSTLFLCGRSGTYSFPDLSFVRHFGLCGRLGTCCLLTSTFVFSWQVWYGTYL